MNIKESTNNKYEGNKKIGGGAFSSIYEINKLKDNKNKFVAKIYSEDTKYDAITEIESLFTLKKNKQKFKEYVNTLNISNSQSAIIDLEDYYLKDEDNIILIFKKYLCTLEEFNIEYNKFFGKKIPINIIDYITNKLFYGLLELQFSELIHCDIKPDNIMISIKGYKKISSIFNNFDKIDINDIDVKIIDFNKVQQMSSIFKSTNIQTLYYIAPEIVLGNREYNYSIDLWSIGCVIYELLTYTFLFDIYNYKNIEEAFSDNKNSEDSESNENTKSESNDSEYENDKFNNLAVLHLYNQIIGENKFITGRYINKYYSNGKLIGGYKSIENNNFLKNIDINYNNILSKIFVYNYNDRLSIKDYFLDYAR